MGSGAGGRGGGGGGGGGAPRLTHPAALSLRTLALRMSVPDSFVGTGTALQLDRLQSRLEGLGLSGNRERRSAENQTVGNLRPSGHGNWGKG